MSLVGRHKYKKLEAYDKLKLMKFCQHRHSLISLCALTIKQMSAPRLKQDYVVFFVQQRYGVNVPKRAQFLK